MKQGKNIVNGCKRKYIREVRMFPRFYDFIEQKLLEKL